MLLREWMIVLMVVVIPGLIALPPFLGWASYSYWWCAVPIAVYVVMLAVILYFVGSNDNW